MPTLNNITQNRIISLEFIEQLFLGTSNCCGRYSYCFLFYRSVYNLPDFAMLFLKVLFTTLKARTNQQKVTLLKMEIGSYLIPISKN